MIKQTYKKWIAACTVTSSLLLGACTSTPPSVRDVSIVPLPNNVQQDSSAFVLPKSCTIGITDSRLAPAAEYLAGILSPSTGYNIKVQDGEGTITLSLGEVEGKEGAYQLKTDTKKINIKGNSYGGVIAGIESLRQLFPPQIESKQIVDGVDWAIPSVEINDAPRFTWRGIMLDVSRHFYSKDEVKELFSSFNGDISAGLINVTMNSAPTFLAYADVKNGNALEALYKNKQALGLKKGEDIMELGKDEYVYKTRGMNIFFGIKDKQMYATNDELLYKSIGKAVDKSIKDAPYAAEMKGKTVFMAINAEAILDLPVIKMLVGFGGKEFKTYSDLASKVSYLSVSSEGETSETDLCLKDKDVNALKQIVDFAKQFAGM